MVRPLHLLAIALFIGCSPAVPEESSPAATQEARLREPDVQYEPTPQRVVDRMLKLARVGPGDVVYDLGSGDGRIPITAARDYGARGVGIDIDPERIAESEANARDAGVADRVTFRNEDLLRADFREATVVTLFLSRELNRKVKPRLLAELKPGTRVVSYYHAMPGWQPKQILRAGDDYLYLWTIPER
jgi:SAM-dependent methyltransferase